MFERLEKNRERELPRNLRLVWHQGSCSMLKLFSRPVDSDGNVYGNIEEIESIINLDGQMEKEFERLFKKAKRLAKEHDGFHSGMGWRRYQLTRIDDENKVVENNNNAPLRIGPDGHFSPKEILFKIGHRIFKQVK